MSGLSRFLFGKPPDPPPPKPHLPAKQFSMSEIIDDSYWNKKLLPLVPHVPTPSEYTAQDWRDLQSQYPATTQGTLDFAKLREQVHPIISPYMKDAMVTNLATVHPYSQLQAFRHDMWNPEQLTTGNRSKHHAGMILTPRATHIGVVRHTPEGAVKLWDPHAIPITNPASTFYGVRNKFVDLPNFVPQEPLPFFQTDRGTCRAHGIDRMIHTFQDDPEYHGKLDNAFHRSALKHSGIPEREWADLAAIQRFDQINNTGLVDPDKEWSNVKRREYQDTRIASGKPRKGFRRS